MGGTMNNEWEVDRDYGYIYTYIYTVTIDKYIEYITVLLCRTET